MFKNLGIHFKKNINIKIKKRIDKYILNPKWIILQVVNFDEDLHDKIALAILIDKYNYQKIIDMIPTKNYVLLIGSRNMTALMYRYCQSRDLRAYVHFTN